MTPPDTAARERADRAPTDEAHTTAEPALVEDETLVEEVSIDGMCGVY